MKHLFTIIITTLSCITSTCYATMPTIAITQITAHPTLDRIYQGVLDGLDSEGFTKDKTANITFANAQGDVSTAVQIAQKFASTQPDVIIAIATPSAQAAAQAVKNTDIPLIFSAVTDPVGSGLVTDLKSPQNNITGTIAASPIKELLELIKKVRPETTKLGVILNYGEANSIELLEDLKREAKSLNINILKAESTNSSEVSTATKSLIGRVDGIFLIQDNTVASGVSALMQVANHEGVPVYSTFSEAAPLGAVISLAYDDYYTGKAAGEMAAAILNGQPVDSLSVRTPKVLRMEANLTHATALNIKISEDLIKQAAKIHQ